MMSGVDRDLDAGLLRPIYRARAGAGFSLVPGHVAELSQALRSPQMAQARWQ